MEQVRVVFHGRVRNLVGNRRAGARVRAAKYGGHAAAGRHSLDSIMIELRAEAKRDDGLLLTGSHCLRNYGKAYKEGIKSPSKAH
jgi:hypothetical protein